jgi:hypothetical protein
MSVFRRAVEVGFPDATPAAIFGRIPGHGPMSA